MSACFEAVNEIYMFLSKVTAPQDAHKRLVLQVYLGSNALEVQCYTQVKCLLVGFRKQKFTATQLQDLELRGTMSVWFEAIHEIYMFQSVHVV